MVTGSARIFWHGGFHHRSISIFFTPAPATPAAPSPDGPMLCGGGVRCCADGAGNRVGEACIAWKWDPGRRMDAYHYNCLGVGQKWAHPGPSPMGSAVLCRHVYV